MAITLPDIVQRVVLDTRGFSASSKGLSSELKTAGSHAEGAVASTEKLSQSAERAAKSQDKHASALTRMHAGLRRASPSLLTLGNNFFKARAGGASFGQAIAGATGAVNKHTAAHTKLKAKLLEGIKTAAKFVAKFALIGAVITSLIGPAASLIGGLGGLITSLGSVIGLLPAMGGALLGVVATMGVVKFLFGGLKEQMKAADKAAAANAGTSKEVAAAQKQVASATKGVISARQDEVKAQEHIGEVIRDAQRKVRDATEQADDAQIKLTESEGKALSARRALTAAYDEARKNLVEVRRESERASISEARSGMALRNAQQALAQGIASGATGDDLLNLQLDLQSAQLDAADASDANNASQKKLADTEKKGIKNSDAVLTARHDLAEANLEVARSTREAADAEDNLAEAQRSGLRDIADARQDALDATEKVADAQRDLADALAEVETAKHGGVNKDELPTGAAKELIDKLRSAKKETKGLREEAQKVAFPGFIKGIDGGLGLLKRFRGNIVATAGVAGRQVPKITDAFVGVGDEVDTVWKANNRLFDTLGNVVAAVIGAMARVAKSGSFVLDIFAHVNLVFSEWLTKVTSGADVQQRMSAFFVRALVEAVKWWHILRDLAIGLYNIFAQASDSGHKLTSSIEDGAAKFRAWTEKAANKNQLKEFFEKGRETLMAVSATLGNVLALIGHIAKGPAADAFRALLEDVNQGSGTGGLYAILEKIGTTGAEGFFKALKGVLDAITGKKDATTSVESIATSMQKLSTVGGAGTLDVFAGVLGGLVDSIKWMQEHVPGFNKILGALATALAIKVVAQKTGITAAARSVMGAIIDVVRLINNKKYGPKKVFQQLELMNKALCGDKGACEQGAGKALKRTREESKKTIKPMGDVQHAVHDALCDDNPCLTGARKAIEGTGVEAEKAGKPIGRFRGQMGSLRGKTEVAAGSIAAMGGAALVLGQVVGGSAGDKLSKYGSIVAAFGGALGGLADVPWGKIGSGLKGMIGETGLLNTVMEANPIFLVIAAVIALGVVFFLLYKKVAPFRRFIDNLWQGLQALADIVIPAVVAAFKWWWNAVKVYFGFIVGIVKDVLAPVFRFLWTIVKLYFTIIFKVISTYVKIWIGIFKIVIWFITKVLVPIFKFLWIMIKSALWIIGQLFKVWWNLMVKPIFMLVMWIIKSVVVPAFMLFWEGLKTILAGIGALFSFWWNSVVKPIFSLVMWIIKSVVLPAFQLWWAGVKIIFAAISAIFHWWWNNVVMRVFGALKWYITNVVIPIWKGIWDAAKTAFDGLKSAVLGVWHFIRSLFTTIATWVTKHVVTIWTGLTSAIGSAFGLIPTIISGAMDLAKKALGAALRGLGTLVGGVLTVLADIADHIPPMAPIAKALHAAAKSAHGWGREAAPATKKGKVRAVGGGGGQVGSLHMAEGGLVPLGAFAGAPHSEVGAGFVTGTPRAIVGEGSRSPEYVVPTDPTHRARALGLWSALGRDLKVPGYSLGGKLLEAVTGPATMAAARLAVEHGWPKGRLRPDSNSLLSFPEGIANMVRDGFVGMLGMAKGGIVSDEVFARIGEMGREAVIPLDSIQGKKMLSGGGVYIDRIIVDARGSNLTEAQIKHAVESALDEVAQYTEIGVHA